MKRLKLTTFSKLLITAVIVGGLFGLFKLAQSQGWIPGMVPQISKTLPQGAAKNTPIFNVGVVTWGGYAGGQYFNGSFKASADSRYYKEYGILVNFIVLDDFVASREAFKAGKVDLLWVTADAFPTESANLPDNPVFLFQADWSRGGDAIVVQRDIKSINDLAGKKIAVAFGTPSHSFLLWMLKAAGMSHTQVKIVEVPNAVDAATTFKSGAVDAAVVWSPDDAECVKKVPGAKILKNTKQASHIIADGFLVKKAFLDANRRDLLSLAKGWLTGAAEINQNETAKTQAVAILAKGLNIDEGLARTSIDNVRLTTYGDNLNFFGLNPEYTGVKGEDLYDSMTQEYTAIGLIKGRVPAWRAVTETSFVRDLNMTGPQHAGETDMKFSAPTVALQTADPFAVKKVTINFEGGSEELGENAKRIIDLEVGSIAKGFAYSRVRIEGNTAKTPSSRDYHIAFSKKRAQAVANYLVRQYKFDPNRFVIVGNGYDKPVAPHETAEGRAKNRRTDFVILNQ